MTVEYLDPRQRVKHEEQRVAAGEVDRQACLDLRQRKRPYEDRELPSLAIEHFGSFITLYLCTFE